MEWKHFIWMINVDEKLPLGNFKWVNETSKFNEVFVKSYNDDSDEGYFLDVHVQYLENLHNFENDLSFLTERMKIEKFLKICNKLVWKRRIFSKNKAKNDF